MANGRCHYRARKRVVTERSRSASIGALPRGVTGCHLPAVSGEGFGAVTSSAIGYRPVGVVDFARSVWGQEPCLFPVEMVAWPQGRPIGTRVRVGRVRGSWVRGLQLASPAGRIQFGDQGAHIEKVQSCAVVEGR